MALPHCKIGERSALERTPAVFDSAAYAYLNILERLPGRASASVPQRPTALQAIRPFVPLLATLLMALQHSSSSVGSAAVHRGHVAFQLIAEPSEFVAEQRVVLATLLGLTQATVTAIAAVTLTAAMLPAPEELYAVSMKAVGELSHKVCARATLTWRTRLLPVVTFLGACLDTCSAGRSLLSTDSIEQRRGRGRKSHLVRSINALTCLQVRDRVWSTSTLSIVTNMLIQSAPASHHMTVIGGAEGTLWETLLEGWPEDSTLSAAHKLLAFVAAKGTMEGRSGHMPEGEKVPLPWPLVPFILSSLLACLPRLCHFCWLEPLCYGGNRCPSIDSAGV
jgi:hypothetical protein